MFTSELYRLNRGAMSTILVPDSDGVPSSPQSSPLIFSCEYLAADFTDAQLVAARATTTSEKCSLFVCASCPEGPPYRAGMIFTFQVVIKGASWFDGKVPRHGVALTKFAATTPMGSWAWTGDAMNGRPGYLLMGHSGDSALWKICRVEVDALKRSVLTVAPVQFGIRCPRADFAAIGDPTIRTEVSQQYDELGRRISGGAYRDVPTKVRNIVEGVVAYKLQRQGRTTHSDLGRDLQVIKTALEDPAVRNSCGWQDMEYHRLHKIRLVHAYTHPGSVVTSGIPLRPDFALSVVEDLVELLRIWGYVAV